MANTSGSRRKSTLGVQVTDYRHDDTRKNIPPAKIAAEGRVPEVPKINYSYSPRLDPALRFDETGHADYVPQLLQKARQSVLSEEEVNALADALRTHEPWLEWAGKRELKGVNVDPVALHIHERVSAQAILKIAARQDVTRDLFAYPQQDYRQAVQFYQHDIDWTNRLILGDSLQVMASLAQREDLAGKVQMIYLDPPYGINFASNFQPQIAKRSVQDIQADLTREPEAIRAFRDTWNLGIHSYLTYLKDRFLSCRDLLADTGSIFVQIGVDNVHIVRNVLDDVFGRSNAIVTIVVQKKGSQKGDFVQPINDFILWYAKSKSGHSHASRPMFFPLYEDKADLSEDSYDWVEFSDGAEQRISGELPEGSAAFSPNPLTSGGVRANQSLPFWYRGREFNPGDGNCWKTTARPVGENKHSGMERLAQANRIWIGRNQLRFKAYQRDFGLKRLTNFWTGLSGARDPVYVVQTNARIIERCMLMTTRPGDIVLDPTCGSGTTAFVAEQWGRRWITIDTSRVSIAIARQRLMTATFDYYELKDETPRVSGGFRYRSVPHITLKSIAQNTHLDPIFSKHEPILDERLTACNAALAEMTDNIRDLLNAKLLMKQRGEGRRSITDADSRRWDLPAKGTAFEHWTIPFDSDPDWPTVLSESVVAYRAAWRAKLNEIDACIALNAEQEELVDQPVIKRGAVRVSGPFTVEAIQPPDTSLGELIETSIGGEPEEIDDTFVGELANTNATDGDSEAKNAEAYLDQMMQLIRIDGVRFPDNKQMIFTRLDSMASRTNAIHAEGRWVPLGEEDNDREGRATVAAAFGPQYGPVTAQQVEQLIRASARRGYDDLVIAGFNFDGPAQAIIDEADHPDVRVHMAHIRPDVNPGMAGLLKEQPGAQLFTVFGQPRTTLIGLNQNGDYIVRMDGVDIYNPVENTVTPSRADKVAAWFLDADYDGRTFCITQAFFPDKSAWSKLAKALSGMVVPDTFEKLSGTESMPFPAGKHRCIAVKVIDPRGNEVMRVHRLEA